MSLRTCSQSDVKSEKQTYTTTLSFLGTWGHGDSSLGYIDMETVADTPPLYTLISGDVGTWGHFSRIYRCGDRDRHTTPIHSFLGTWGHGDTSLGYIDVETWTDTPPLYTLISGDVGTRGHFSRIYRCGDRDRHTTPIHSHFWGLGDTGTLL